MKKRSQEEIERLVEILSSNGGDRFFTDSAIESIRRAIHYFVKNPDDKDAIVRYLDNIEEEMIEFLPFLSKNNKDYTKIKEPIFTRFDLLDL